jgi:6-phosphogluconate dehydrogenase
MTRAPDSVADIGLVGLAVMGQNLALNMADHGFRVAVFNRTVAKVDEFLAGPGEGANVVGTHSAADLVRRLAPPRRIVLMVRAGTAVDLTIAELMPHLEPGDIVVDGGNSNFTDSIRRYRELSERGLLFVGAGVSGGEEGARHGPSIMPGGAATAWPHIQEILQAISAKVDGGTPCCDWVGPDGAGHYVKMVHNGIEYGDMQLIAEAYHLLGQGLGLSARELQKVFSEWNEGPLDSYLIGITADILGFLDEDGRPLADKILDAAGQKGTGKWTVVSSLDLGQPVTLVAEAVFARALSALKGERVAAARALGARPAAFDGSREQLVADIHDALYASKIVSYAQGFMLFRAASEEYGWNLDLGSIALMWRGGCIIRSAFLGEIKGAYDRDSSLQNLLLDPYFASEVAAAEPGWRRAVTAAVQLGIPIPAYSSALAFYDGYRSARLPANLIQAQRDYFGAHTYERSDRERGEFFHTNWTGRGGDTSSGSYSA